MYSTVLLDLDGTLTDPGLGITNSVAYALDKFSIKVADRRELYRFIGPPLYDSFRGFYGFSHDDALAAVRYYREYFTDRGIFENKVYDGTVKMLSALKAAGKRILLATSKPEVYAKHILEHFELDGYFDFVGGATMDETRNKKADVIAYVISECSITDVSDAVMVGDREHDILGAKAHGLHSIGVLYGYGDIDELRTAGATYIAERVEDILLYV